VTFLVTRDRQACGESHLFDLSEIAVVVLLIATAVLLYALLITQARARKQRSEITNLEHRLVRTEAQTKEQSRMISRLESDKGSVASLARSLPTVVRELNSGDIEPRQVPQLIVNLAREIFQPAQVLFYTTRNTQGGGQELALSYGFGLGEIPEQLKVVPFHKGKIGWVATHRIDMLREDWINPQRTEGVRVEDNHPTLKADIVGPLVHHSRDNEQVLGVLCIGAPASMPRDEKLMFQLVTNLGSLALINAQLVTRLKGQANTDGLTGLLNKRYFMDELLPQMIVEVDQHARSLALFIFDLDHFKTYNDTNGHPAGDELLRGLAELLRRQLRPSDRCCRYGGEEFVVAMPNTTREEGLRIAERIRSAVEGEPFAHREKQPGGRVTISGGLAVLPHDGNSAADLTKHADVALYQSKRRGRNRITPYQGVDIGDAEDASGFDLVSLGD